MCKDTAVHLLVAQRQCNRYCRPRDVAAVNTRRPDINKVRCFSVLDAFATDWSILGSRSQNLYEVLDRMQAIVLLCWYDNFFAPFTPRWKLQWTADFLNPERPLNAFIKVTFGGVIRYCWLQCLVSCSKTIPHLVLGYLAIRRPARNLKRKLAASMQPNSGKLFG